MNPLPTLEVSQEQESAETASPHYAHLGECVCTSALPGVGSGMYHSVQEILIMFSLLATFQTKKSRPRLILHLIAE